MLEEHGLLCRAPEKAVTKSNKSRFEPKLFLHMSVWTVFVCGFVQNCQVYIAEWFPVFFTIHLGITPEVASLCLVLAASVELPARALTKSLPDVLAARGVTLLHSRQAMSLQGFFYHMAMCISFALLLDQGMTSPLPFTLIFACARASQAMHAGGYFANYLDLSRDHVGMLTGLGNTLASIAGVATPKFVAFNLHYSKYPWRVIGAAGACLNLLAILLVSKFMSTHCLDAEPASPVNGGTGLHGEDDGKRVN